MEMQKVRTDEAVRNISGQFNEATENRHYINEVRFSFHNHREIMDALESGRAVDIARVPKQKTKSVMIIGSGHSLNDALPLMKDWAGDIICSTSHATTLIAAGREPEHIVALDPDSNPAELAADTWEGRNSMLHLHPGVNPDLVRWWKGPIALFRKMQPQTPFYSHEQAVGYSPLGPMEKGRYKGDEVQLSVPSEVPMLACVMAAQILIAKYLGYKQQVLVGADFSWRDDNTRFTSRTWEDGKWIEHKPATVQDLIGSLEKGGVADPIVETEHDGLMTTPMQIFYSHQTVVAWRVSECNVINTSPDGILRVFPYVPIEEVVRRGNKGVKGFNLKQIRRVSEEHLATQNIFFINVGSVGIIPHEFRDPLHEVPKALADLKARLTAQGKGDDMDIEANMKRIKRLFRKVADAS